MADMQYGGWYDNPAAGGANMRFWGDKGWTTGSEPGGSPSNSGGGSSSPSSPSAPTIPAFDPAPYDALTKSIPKAADFATTLNGNDDKAFSDYLNYMKSQQSPLDFYTSVSQSQGIPQMQDTAKTLQGQIYNLEDSLSRLPADTLANTGNSLVTDSQRQGIINEKSTPIQNNLTKQSTAYGRVSSALTDAKNQALTLTNLNQQGVQQGADVYKTHIQTVAEENARAMTGFTTDLQNQLTIGLQRIARGEKVSDQQASQMFDMLKMEKEYQLQAQNEEAKMTEQQKIDQAKIKSLGKYGGAYVDANGNVQYVTNPNGGGGSGGGDVLQAPAGSSDPGGYFG